MKVLNDKDGGRQVSRQPRRNDPQCLDTACGSSNTDDIMGLHSALLQMVLRSQCGTNVELGVWLQSVSMHFG
jgi:hypothetical protein